jgi:hypothetical protein
MECYLVYEDLRGFMHVSQRFGGTCCLHSHERSVWGEEFLGVCMLVTQTLGWGIRNGAGVQCSVAFKRAVLLLTVSIDPAQIALSLSLAGLIGRLACGVPMYTKRLRAQHPAQTEDKCAALAVCGSHLAALLWDGKQSVCCRLTIRARTQTGLRQGSEGASLNASCSSSLHNSKLKTEAVCCSETSISTYKALRCHNKKTVTCTLFQTC